MFDHLLDGEFGKSVLTRVLVGLGDNPSRSVRDSEIHYLAGQHEGVQGLHELLDRGRMIPPVDVEDVHVVGL